MATDKSDEAIADEVLEQLLEGRDPGTVFECGGLVDELKKRLAERMHNAEMEQHYSGTAETEQEAGNHPQWLSGSKNFNYRIGQARAGDRSRLSRSLLIRC